MQLSQKETELLKDMKNEEKLCAEKYENYSEKAKDEQLKQLCKNIAGVERGHFDTLTQIENGDIPIQNGGGQSSSPSFVENYGAADTEDKKNDCFIAQDLLTTEKGASHLYDTCIFEFRDGQIRDTLNHIQKEEQGHGKALYDYMSTNNMYS